MPATTRIVSALVCLLSLTLWGCGDTAPGREMEEWLLERHVTIGSIDDSDYALTYVGTLAVDGDGTIFVSQPRERLIRVFSPTGEFVRTVGREGQGPGEFQSLGSMGWMADTLFVSDYPNQRVSLFDRGGRFVRSLNLMSPMIDSVFIPSAPNRMLPDGTALVSPEYVSGPSGELTVTARPLFRIDTTGAVLLKVAETSVENTGLVIRMGTAALATSQPFSDAPLLALPPDAAHVIVVERYTAAEGGRGLMRVIKITVDGDTLFTREIPYTPLPLPGQVVDSVLNARAQDYSALPLFESAREARQALDNEAFVPAFYPPVTNVQATSDGRIWLKRESVPGPEARWEILSPEGEPLAYVALPSSTRVHDSRGELMWATERDELDVTYVVRYRIMPKETPR